MTDKNTNAPSAEGGSERYAVKYRRAYPLQPGCEYIWADGVVEAMTKAEKWCNKAGYQLMSVIPDPEEG